MNSTFSRAVIGFIVLTMAMAALSMVALWAVDTYAGSYAWIGIVVVLLALATEIGIYRSTLHDPVHDWIAEPKLERIERERQAKK